MAAGGLIVTSIAALVGIVSAGLSVRSAAASNSAADRSERALALHYQPSVSVIWRGPSMGLKPDFEQDLLVEVNLEAQGDLLDARVAWLDHEQRLRVPTNQVRLSGVRCERSLSYIWHRDYHPDGAVAGQSSKSQTFATRECSITVSAEDVDTRHLWATTVDLTDSGKVIQEMTSSKLDYQGRSARYLD